MATRGAVLGFGLSNQTGLRMWNPVSGSSVWGIGMSNDFSRLDIFYGDSNQPITNTNVDMSILTNGRVGIGTTVPGSLLSVAGGASIGSSTSYTGIAAPTDGLLVQGNVGIGTTVPGSTLSVSGGVGIGTGTAYTGGTAPTNGLMVQGRVGIGLTNPSYPLHVSGNVSGTPPTTAGAVYWSATGSQGYPTAAPQPISIYATGWIWSGNAVIVASDARIKRNIKSIENPINKTRSLKPVSYEYIDIVANGNQQYLGFIAQEVKEIIPSAVSKHKEYIPNVFSLANILNKVIQLDKEHNFIVGDKVKFIPKDGNEFSGIVTEVPTSTSFCVDTPIDEPQVFVYGKEVTDFNVLDKDMIMTVGIAAIQELDRELQNTKAQLARMTEFLASKFPGEWLSDSTAL